MYDDILARAATAYGLNPDELRRIMMIESGGNPRATTGSYHGLFQLSPTEFQKYGGGNIYDPQDNAMAAARKMASDRAQFTQQFGRQPDAADTYLIHQQGAGGAAAHMANPSAPAWQNMASTGEGQQKGPGWARQAIWGNIPDNARTSPSFNKQMFPGGVDSVTSQQFMDGWRSKVTGQPAPPPQPLPPGSDAGLGGQAGQATAGALMGDPTTAAALAAAPGASLSPTGPGTIPGNVPEGATAGPGGLSGPGGALFGAMGIDPSSLGLSDAGLKIPGLGTITGGTSAAQGNDKDAQAPTPPPMGFSPLRKPLDMRAIMALAQPQQLGILGSF